ncbi:PREDICTED: histone-lysine N-methyltransferase 2C [Tarenaya hassleriana]|uniref:histone-lysine N-methyltransferase 2C n=1 Tax=Tarenaya hassleriana TaxID=28532 RepID=UPI00053C7CEA|nr:PREDICTED: histone-lysine N-methyltransferase 2C [Tarenaya hassleriana]XP_010547265.1 PREDICTED: histone-lysine N-methyltransferase 2C [Tarenaya hassleriana]
MAFHVACPITCHRICFCSQGFPGDLRGVDAKDEFLKQVDLLKDLLKDPLGDSRVFRDGTVQVRVPKVVSAPSVVVVGDGGGADETAVAMEEAAAQKKRVALQKQAAVAVEAAKDYARRFESAFTAVSSKDQGGEELGNSDSNAMCKLCFLGESEGSERARRMLSCKNCGKKYHKNCLKSWAQHRDLFHWSSWTCPSCRVCEICHRTGDPNKFMFCKRCDAAYHCYCQHPPHKNVSSGPYLCPKHTRCHSCGSTVPGNGLSVRWFLSYTCCDACGRLFVKGNYCPICLKVYRDSESTPMVCCDICQRWVHCRCDGISDEKYLQFQVDGNLQYKCATCRGECYQVKDLQDAVQELWKRKDVVDRELIASLRAAAGLPTEEDIFSISPFSDDEENGPVSGRSLKFSVKGLVENSPKKIKEHIKNSSNKKHVSKTGHLSKLEPQQDSELYQNIESEDYVAGAKKNEDMEFHRNGGSDISSRVAGICSTHEPKIVKHKLVDDVMVTEEDRPSRIVKIKCSKPQDSDSEDAQKNVGKVNAIKAKKLVISLGAKKINVSNSSKSSASQHPRDQDQSSSGGGEDMQESKAEKPLFGGDKTTAKKGDRLDQPGEVRSLKISGRFGKTQPEDIVVLSEEKCNSFGKPGEGSKTTFGSITQFPTSKSEDNRKDDKTTVSHSVKKEARPLLKFKLRKPNPGDQTPQDPHSEDEKLSAAKGQRSKRKKPSPLVDKSSSLNEDENFSHSNLDSPRNEMMDANWILKKLGKDSIGKRVEILQRSDKSWRKGTVTDVTGDSSTLSVSLDDGGVNTLELGKHSVRFIPQKQKRSRS